MDDAEGTYAPQSPDLSEYQSYEPPANQYPNTYAPPQQHQQSTFQPSYPQSSTFDPFASDTSSYPPPNPYQPKPIMHHNGRVEPQLAADEDHIPETTSTTKGPSGRRSKKPKIEEETCDKPAPGLEEGIEVKTKFPVARIKRIMQADEDVGKVSQVTPTAVCKSHLTSTLAQRYFPSPHSRRKDEK